MPECWILRELSLSLWGGERHQASWNGTVEGEHAHQWLRFPTSHQHQHQINRAHRCLQVRSTPLHFPLIVLKWIWAQQGQKISLGEYKFCCRLRRAAWGRVWNSPGKPLGAALLCLILVSWKRSCLRYTLCWRMIIAVRGEVLLVHKGCLTNMYAQCAVCAVYLSICLYLFQKIFLTLSLP